MERTILAAESFGKVAVLMGGRSAEREVSLASGTAVLSALLKQGVDAHKVDTANDLNIQLQVGMFDRAFIVLHGRGGEDGEIQAVLSALYIPYTGSEMMGAVLSMNKMLSKQIWIQQNLPTARYEQVTSESDSHSVVSNIGLPLFIKPVNEGSSIGMSKVNLKAELMTAITLAEQYDVEVIAEKGIEGKEYTVAILNNVALPVFQVKTPNEFYDFEAKYKTDTTEYLCPCGLSKQEELQCQQLALDAFHALRMKGWGRIDFMQDSDGQFYLLEANSVPGMTDHSLVPMAAKQAGLIFTDLVWLILETSMEAAK